MSSTSEHAHAGGEAELPCEPDDVPVRFLSIISAAVTLMVLVLVGIAVWLFDVTTASELAAKGYSVEGSVPVQTAPADAADGSDASE